MLVANDQNTTFLFPLTFELKKKKLTFVDELSFAEPSWQRCAAMHCYKPYGFGRYTGQGTTTPSVPIYIRTILIKIKIINDSSLALFLFGFKFYGVQNKSNYND